MRGNWRAILAGLVTLIALGAIAAWLLTWGARGAEVANVVALPIAALGTGIAAIATFRGAQSNAEGVRDSNAEVDGPGDGRPEQDARQRWGLVSRRIFSVANLRSAAVIGLSIIVLIGSLPGMITFFTTVIEPAPTAADACAPSEFKREPSLGELRVGTVFPYTGVLRAQGFALSRAASMAVRDVDSAGGVPGSRLVLQDQLDEGDPGSAQACRSARELLARGVGAIVGPVSSATSRSLAPTVSGTGAVLISPASTAPELTTMSSEDRFFRTALSDELQGRVLGDLIFGEQNTRVVILARADPYGDELKRQAAEEMRGLGLSVEERTYSSDGAKQAGDLVAEGERLVQTRPDAVALIGFAELSDFLGRYKPALPGTRFYGADGLMRENLPDQTASNSPRLLDGMRGTRPLLTEEFKSSLIAFAGQGIEDFTYTSQAYDAVIVTALAAAAANSGDPDLYVSEINAVTRGGVKCTSYRQCVEILKVNRRTDIDYDGPSGPLDFTGAGEPCQGLYSVVEFDSGRLRDTQEAFGWKLCTGILSR